MIHFHNVSWYFSTPSLLGCWVISASVLGPIQPLFRDEPVGPPSPERWLGVQDWGLVSDVSSQIKNVMILRYCCLKTAVSFKVLVHA